MSLLPPVESASALSVIPEASDENFGSSALFHFHLKQSKVVLDSPVEAGPVEAILPTKYSVHVKDGEVNQFRTVVLTSKQPYSSCCCTLF